MAIREHADRKPLFNLFVPGQPQPGGSKKGFVNPKTKRVVITDDAAHGSDWRARVAHFAREVYKDEPARGMILLQVVFTLRRPRGHYGTGRNVDQLKPSAPYYRARLPDLTKLVRATEDALTGIVWVDDSQVVIQETAKRYGPKPGANIGVWRLDD